MPFDFEKLAEVVITLIIASSVFIVAVAIAWRLVWKPTMRGLFEYRATRGGEDPPLSHRVTELEEELRALKDRVGALTEGSSSRLLGTPPWRGTKEKT